MNKLVEALKKIEDILVEVSANLVNKSKEQELLHKAFLVSKKALQEHAANNDIEDSDVDTVREIMKNNGWEGYSVKEIESLIRIFGIFYKTPQHAANKDNTYKAFEDLIIHALENDLHGAILDRAKDALTHPNPQP